MSRTLFSKIKRRAVGAGERLHDDQRGAIMLAALAAFMILILVAMIIWDAGQAARDKIDVQNAADSAAHSQASVRARSMNMLAFTNVAKREVTSLHSVYFGMFTGFALWVGNRCSESAAQSSEAAEDCRNNRPLLLMEGRDEWFQFSGDQYQMAEEAPEVGAQIGNHMTNTNGSLSETAFENEVMALDDYQRYLVQVTPWWAWVEGLIRGTRNGAHVTTSFPVPGDLASGSANGWIDQSSSAPNARYGMRSSVADEVQDFQVSCGNGAESTLLDRGRSFGEPSFYEGCISGEADDYAKGPFNIDKRGERNPLSKPARDALSGTIDIHSRNSNVDAGSELPVGVGIAVAIDFSIPFLSDRPWGGGCFWALRNFTSSDSNPECPGDNPRRHAVPYHLDANTSSSEDLMARSNLVFSYKYTPDRKMEIQSSGRVKGGDGDAKKRNILPASGYKVKNSSSVTYTTEGYWSMARAEISYPNLDYSNDTHLTDHSVNGGWLWRPGWTAKLRPIALPGEWQNLGYPLSDAFEATDPYFQVAGDIGVLNNYPDANDPSDFAQDFQFMQKATRTMDPNVIEGTTK